MTIWHNHCLSSSNVQFILLLQILVCGIQHFQAKQNAQKTTVEELTDIKDFKKILRTKNNVLVCYVISQKQGSNIVKIFKEAAEIVKGQGTMLLVDCSGWVTAHPQNISSLNLVNLLITEHYFPLFFPYFCPFCIFISLTPFSFSAFLSLSFFCPIIIPLPSPHHSC
jgi:hypothetical protein